MSSIPVFEPDLTVVGSSIDIFYPHSEIVIHILKRAMWITISECG